MHTAFYISLAVRALRNNRRRTILTVAIIGIGIMALVSILTASDVLRASVNDNFSSMGANSFQIISNVIKQRHGSIAVDNGKVISYAEAIEFKKRYYFPSIVGISVNGAGGATARHQEFKTDPNVLVLGIDENYLTIADTKLSAGRGFSTYELSSGSYNCIIGSDLVKSLFRNKANKAIGNYITIGGRRYNIVGVMETKGASMIVNTDNSVLVPLSNARAVYGGGKSFVISVAVNTPPQKDVAKEEAEGLLHLIRKLPLGAPNNFTIRENNSLVETFNKISGYVNQAAFAIGLITILGSLVGLLNIMLVSVAERTREIGINKALGAKSSSIRSQFLTESVLISLLGGFSGIVAGIIIGNLVALGLKSSFVIPWLWIGIAIALCTLVGIIAGIYPAIRAARLNPINALRYE